MVQYSQLSFKNLIIKNFKQYSLIYYTRANIYYTGSSNLNQPQKSPPLENTRTIDLEIIDTI